MRPEYTISITSRYRSAGTAHLTYSVVQDQSASLYPEASEVGRLIGASVQSEVAMNVATAGHATWVALGCEGATTRSYTVALP